MFLPERDLPPLPVAQVARWLQWEGASLKAPQKLPPDAVGDICPPTLLLPLLLLLLLLPPVGCRCASWLHALPRAPA